MPHLSIDIILFSVFLALNLVIGLLAGRHVKNIREFAIGNKDFSTGTIVATIIVSEIGGFMSYGLQNTYTKGLLFIIPLLGCSLSFLLIGQVLLVRMGELLNNPSAAEGVSNLWQLGKKSPINLYKEKILIISVAILDRIHFH